MPKSENVGPTVEEIPEVYVYECQHVSVLHVSDMS